VGGDRTKVMLGDNVFERYLRPCVDAFAKQKQGARVVLTREADREHLRHLGVAHMDGAKRIERIVEKPDDPPSELAVTGVYFYDETVWKVISDLEPSGRGELEITDVNNWYLDHGLIEYDIVEGWGDAAIDAGLLTGAGFRLPSGVNQRDDLGSKTTRRRAGGLVTHADERGFFWRGDARDRRLFDTSASEPLADASRRHQGMVHPPKADRLLYVIGSLKVALYDGARTPTKGQLMSS
jgi:hypothetical protein